MIKRAYISGVQRLKLMILVMPIFCIIHFYATIKSKSLQIVPRALNASVSKTTSKNNTNYKLIDLNDFHFVINSENKCNECYNDTIIVFVVSSCLTNTNHRQAIRDTWGQNTDCIKILYFVGTSDDANSTQSIQEESERYQDIIQGSFKDTYRNLTYKHAMELKWVSLHCQRAKYIIKTDDDIVVRVDILHDNLKKDQWGSTNLIAGTVMEHKMVLRGPDSKWAVSKEEYQEDFYPNYINGPFIIYSADVVRRLLEEANKVPFFWIEDVHFTGTLTKRIGLNHTNLFWNWYLFNTAELYTKGPKSVQPFIYGPISQSVDDIYKIWKALHGLINLTTTKIS